MNMRKAICGILCGVALQGSVMTSSAQASLAVGAGMITAGVLDQNEAVRIALISTGAVAAGVGIIGSVTLMALSAPFFGVGVGVGFLGLIFDKDVRVNSEFSFLSEETVSSLQTLIKNKAENEKVAVTDDEVRAVLAQQDYSEAETAAVIAAMHK